MYSPSNLEHNIAIVTCVDFKLLEVVELINFTKHSLQMKTIFGTSIRIRPDIFPFYICTYIYTSMIYDCKILLICASMHLFTCHVPRHHSL